MKRSRMLLAGLALGSITLVGCEKAEDAKPAVPQSVQNAADKAGAAAADMKDKAGAAATEVKAKAGEVADAVVAEAQKLFDQAKAYINEKKFDDASKAITSLDALKSKLPAEWAAKIDELKKMLDTAKAAIGNVVPGK